MPVAVLKHHFCRRGSTGPKAHAHAAYLSGTKLNDGKGKTADFRPKGGILHAELWVPEDAPQWAKDRGELWRNLEGREDKSTRPSNAILAHKFIGALPHELSFEENVRFVKDYIREQFTRRGYAADWAIHAPDPGSDSRNYHVHIMVPLRKFEHGTWAKKKDRYPKNSPALSLFIKEKQQAFFDLQNRYLEKNNIDAYIHRKNGRWTVTYEPMPSEANTTLASMHAQRPPYITKPIIRPSLPATKNSRVGMAALFNLASREVTSQPKQNINHSFKLSSGTNGWPPQAIADWASWGHRETIRFFRLWPELASGNSMAMGGISP